MYPKILQREKKKISLVLDSLNCFSIVQFLFQISEYVYLTQKYNENDVLYDKLLFYIY